MLKDEKSVLQKMYKSFSDPYSMPRKSHRSKSKKRSKNLRRKTTSSKHRKRSKSKSSRRASQKKISKLIFRGTTIRFDEPLAASRAAYIRNFLQRWKDSILSNSEIIEILKKRMNLTVRYTAK